MDEGTQSATLSVEQLKMVSLWAIASCNVGTARLIPYDVTNSAAFAAAPTVSHSEEEPMLMNQPWIAAPASCKEWAAQLIGTTATSDIFWNQVWAYKQDNLRLNLPSHENEGFKITAILKAHPSNSGAGANIYRAEDLDLEELIEGRDFRWLMGQEDANPHAILLDRAELMDTPLMVQVRRPESDLTTFAADETASTKAPLHLLIPRVCIEVLKTCLTIEMIGKDEWTRLYAMFDNQLKTAIHDRPKTKTTGRTRWGGVPFMN